MKRVSFGWGILGLGSLDLGLGLLGDWLGRVRRS